MVDIQREADRGRMAGRPREIPAKGWRDVALRVKRETSNDNISIVAAGVAFFGFLAIFPAIAAFVSIYGLVMDPADVQAQVASLKGILPQQTIEILESQLSRVSARGNSTLGWGAAIAILVSVWSATKGMKAVMNGVNIAYDEEESRGFFKLNGIALLMTLGIMLLGLVAIALVAVFPALLGKLGLAAAAATTISILRWPLLAVGLALVLAVVYRFGPSRNQPKWSWVSWGAVIATVLWIVASLGFSFYVANFASYDKTYGSFGAVAILMMWLFVSAYVVLLGAELNSEMEHQTAQDTTRGRPLPMGQREATMADRLGEKP